MKTRINPYLIPRFNIDYGINDFLSALLHLNRLTDTSSIEKIFEGCYVNYANSGRSCLYTILKALDLPSNSCVGVPLYTCSSDFDAIIYAGHRPVFLDISPHNLTLDPEDLRKKINLLDAVVVVHIFGRPADMDAIIKIANGKPVIEDCAHSLLSKYKGNLTGTIGDAGFFSFRSGKYISAGEGGIIVTKDTTIKKRVDEEIATYPAHSLINEVKHSVLTLARSFLYHRPWFGMLSLPLGKMLEKKVDLMNKYSFNVKKIRQTDLYTIQNKIKSFEYKLNTNIFNARYILDMMSEQKYIELLAEPENVFCNYFLFPVLFENKSARDKISNLLMKNGIDNAKMFSSIPDIARERYGYNGDCPVTEKTSERILIIPHYYTLNKEELEKTVYLIRIHLLD